MYNIYIYIYIYDIQCCSTVLDIRDIKSVSCGTGTHDPWISIPMVS